MKQFKLISALALTMLLASCAGEGDASVENVLVVEQVNSNNQTKNDCSTCLQNNYTYKVKLKSHTGNVYYYTNYKHEVGDTLVSIFEFTDNREKVIKQTEAISDSLSTVNHKLQKKNDELSLYNELLMGIIQDNAKKP